MDNNERFDQWNNKKKQLEEGVVYRNIYFNQGDIWWCSLGKNIGTESFGKGDYFRRPVLVLKKLSHETCIVLPLGSQFKAGTWFEKIQILDSETLRPIKDGERWISLYQIRMIHTKRFQRKIGIVSQVEFSCVKEKLGALLELSINHHPVEAEIEGM